MAGPKKRGSGISKDEFEVPEEFGPGTGPGGTLPLPGRRTLGGGSGDGAAAGDGDGDGDGDGLFDADLTGEPDPASTGPNTETGASPPPAADNALAIEEFKFFNCPPLLGEDVPVECPSCIPNPHAYVPDYRMMQDGEVYFDEKKCTVNIVLADWGGEDIIPLLDNAQFIADMREVGVRLLLDAYGKTDVATVFQYEKQPPKKNSMLVEGAVGLAIGGLALGAGLASFGLGAGIVGATAGGLGGAVLGQYIPSPVPGYDITSKQVDIVKDLIAEPEAVTHAIHIPLQLNARTRFLVSISTNYFDKIPEKLVSEPETEFATNLEVTFKGKDFHPILKRIRKAFKVYGNELVRWRRFEGGRLSEVTSAEDPAQRKASFLDLVEEADKIIDFADGIDNMISSEEIGLSFNPLFPAKIPEKIRFKFEEVGPERNLRLRQIIFNKLGCPDIKVGPGGKFPGVFKSLIQMEPFKRTRTLHYVGSAPEIDIDLQAREPTPWLTVVTRYTYPPVQVFYGQNENSIFNEPSLTACFAKSSVNDSGPDGDGSIEGLMEGLENLVLGVPDALIQEFCENSCKTAEQLKKEIKDLNTDNFGDDAMSGAKKIIEEMKRKIGKEDPYLEILLEELVLGAAIKGSMGKSARMTNKMSKPGGAWANPDFKKRAYKKEWRNHIKDQGYGLWSRLNDRLGWCGWVALIMAAMDCVAQGMGEESAMKALTKSAFDSMDDAYVGRSFLGLSPEHQKNVLGALADGFENAPAPWDVGYVAGNYSGAGFSMQEAGEATAEGKANIPDDWLADKLSENYPEFLESEEDLGLYLSGKPLPDGKTMEDLEKEYAKEYRKAERGRNKDIDQAAIEAGYRSGTAGGTYGDAIAGVQKAIFDAYRAAMLDAVGADVLMAQLGKLPGAPLVAKLFKHLPCKITPPWIFDPRLDSFMNTLEFDICAWDADLTLPVLYETLELFVTNIFHMIIEAIKEVIYDTALALFLMVLKFILEKLLSMACELLATLGASLMDLFAGSDHFRNLLKDNLCPDASMDDLHESLGNVFSTLAGPDQTCIESLTNSEISDFIDDLSLMLTQGQILQLLMGEATPETLALAVEVALTSDSECIRDIFSDPSAYNNFFTPLRVFLPDIEELADKIIPDRNYYNSPVHPCPPGVLDRIDDLKCQLLAQKGLTPAQCREQLDDIKDKAIQDMEDLADLLNNGPFSQFPPIVAPRGPPDGPSCPDGLISPNDPLLCDLNNEITSILFETIETAHIKDLWGVINPFTGHGGLLNGILSDTKGRPFKKHNWVVRTFGSPLAADLGFFGMASDNALRKPNVKPDGAPDSSNQAVDIYGEDLKNDPESGINLGKGGSFFGYSEGGYGPTLGAHMWVSYRDMEPNFKTTTTSISSPFGLSNSIPAEMTLSYDAYSDDFNDWEAVPWSFSLEYDYNLVDEQGNLKDNRKYRLKISETHRGYSGDEPTRREQRKMGGEVPPPSILSDEVGVPYTYTSYNLKVKSAPDVEVETIIESLDLSESFDDSYEIEVFHKFLTDILVNKSDDKNSAIANISKTRRHFSDNYDVITNKIIKKISQLIAYEEITPPPENWMEMLTQESSISSKLGGVSRGFLFGYDPEREPKIIELDTEEFGGWLGRLFPELVPPPFYVQERRYEGWMDIADALCPEVDGCEPASQPIFDLTDLKSVVSKFSDEVKADPRLDSDPLCAPEAPFDKIITSYDAGLIEGTIRAVIRVYILDVFVRGVPVFSSLELNSENFDSLLQAFVEERIKQGLYDDAVRASGQIDDEYYYRLLEQVVNNTARKVKSGLIDIDEEFTSEEIDAYEKIVSLSAKEGGVIAGFYKEYEGTLAAMSWAAIKSQTIFNRIFSTPAGSRAAGIGSGSSRFSKKAAVRAKEDAFILTVGKAEKHASVFLRRYIREEFEVLKEKFSKTIPARIPNIHHLFLVNDSWIRGGAYGTGPFNVRSDPQDPGVPIGGDPSWPFVLEKYIRVEDKRKPSPIVRDRKSNLYNIINIEDWDDYVKNLKEQEIEGDISSLWGMPELDGENAITLEEAGHTHSYEMDEDGNGVTDVYTDDAGNEHSHEIIKAVVQESPINPYQGPHQHDFNIEAWKFGLRICYMPSKDEQGVFKGMMSTISAETCMLDKAFRISTPTSAGKSYLIPIASAELPIPDQEFTLFDPESYDVECLIQELVETPEYKTMFKYVFPFSRFTSILAIYSIMGFFASIGNHGLPEEGGDMWEIPGGRKMRKFRKFIRGPQAFLKSRQASRMVFTGAYEASHAIDYEASNKNIDTRTTTSIRQMLRPKVNFEDGLRWWERGRRITNRPFNNDGDLC